MKNNMADAIRQIPSIPDPPSLWKNQIPKIIAGTGIKTAASDLSGYCYDSGDGHYIGRFGKNPAQNVYIGKPAYVFKGDDGKERTHVVDIEKLPNTNHADFQNWASTVYGESTAYKSNDLIELAHEMCAIAYIHLYRNKKAYGFTSELAKIFRNTQLEKRTGKMQLANFAMINAALNTYDHSYGATMWDGEEQSYYDETERRGFVQMKAGKRTIDVELHMNTLGWSISDEHYAKWKTNVGSRFKAPQIRRATDNWGRYRNKDKICLYSTIVYGSTIFWREVK